MTGIHPAAFAGAGASALLILDLSQVSFCDSSGLADPRSYTAHVLRVTGLTGLVRFGIAGRRLVRKKWTYPAGTGRPPFSVDA